MLGDFIKAENAQVEKRVYLNIKDGAIVKRTQSGEERYSFVEGKLRDIFHRERTFRGEAVGYWYVELTDIEDGDLYSLGFYFPSNTFKSVVLQLASERGLEGVRNGFTFRIEPYNKNGYDNVQVFANGAKLDWVIKELPPIEEITIGGKKIKDDTKRMELISSLVDRIKENIPKK